MRGSLRSRLIQGGIAVATSGIMLGAFVGLSSAASPNGHGHSEASHADNGHGSDNGHGNASGAGNASANNGRGDDRGSAPSDDGTRPGWGCGDPNHVHTGPPGGGAGFDPCTFHVVVQTQTFVSGTATQTVTLTETLTGTETATQTATETGTTTSST